MSQITINFLALYLLIGGFLVGGLIGYLLYRRENRNRDDHQES